MPFLRNTLDGAVSPKANKTGTIAFYLLSASHLTFYLGIALGKTKCSSFWGSSMVCLRFDRTRVQALRDLGFEGVSGHTFNGTEVCMAAHSHLSKQTAPTEQPHQTQQVWPHPYISRCTSRGPSITKDTSHPEHELDTTLPQAEGYKPQSASTMKLKDSF